MDDATRALLELTVGPFVLALQTHHVSGVEANPAPSEGGLAVNDAIIPYVDLSELFGQKRGEPAPFAIVMDPAPGAARVAIGVDRVDHVHGATRHPSPIPALGLLRPDLFTAAARVQDRILLVIDPGVLAAVVSGDRGAAGEPNR